MPSYVIVTSKLQIPTKARYFYSRFPWECLLKASKNGSRHMGNKFRGHRGGRSGPVITCPWSSSMASSDVKCYISGFTVNTGMRSIFYTGTS